MSPGIDNNDNVVVNLPMDFVNISHSEPSVNNEDFELKKEYEQLLLACRTGDADAVDSLTLIPNLDINRVDEWNYTPLILASLCGHLHIVKLLLSRGAVCDRDTYEGVRCIYGALNDEIRNLLLSYDITKKVDDNQPFSAHISKLLLVVFSSLSARDLAFVFPGLVDPAHRVFVVNRFLLAARSRYFNSMLTAGGEWMAKSVVVMSEKADAAAFASIIDYIYLRLDSIPISGALSGFRSFAEQFELKELLEVMDELPSSQKGKLQMLKKQQSDLVEVARNELMVFLKENVLASKCEVVLEEDVDFEDVDATTLLDTKIHTKLLQSNAFADIIMSSIDVDSGSVVYYPVHRAVLSRSDYYTTMFKSEMFTNSHEVPVVMVRDQELVDRPNVEIEHVPVLQASVNTTNWQVTEIILEFLYYDNVQHIPSNLSVELLFAADELWIHRLKMLTALSITSLVLTFDYESLLALPDSTGYDVCDLVEISWQTRCDRLEQHMTKLIAHNLEEICSHDNLRERLSGLIRKSAERIRERQETDTIELVDDIRFYLAKKYAVHNDFAELDGVAATWSATREENVRGDNNIYLAAMKDYDEDVLLVETLLEELALEA
ncbi:CIC11C00000000891 [Sungouiella intermedia]|uniref:CIC11C00000000891 n=1 Tax=Sungouiella intermedia TaxID=45354 RepID=A0A1L0DYB9_9ASCO|nr:CIC11C00000000891 [[Candida] intermedia]